MSGLAESIHSQRDWIILLGVEKKKGSGFAMPIAEYRDTALIKRQNPQEYLILRDF